MAGAILDGAMGFQKAAKSYGVPKSTLKRKVKKVKLNNYFPQAAATKKLGRYDSFLHWTRRKNWLDIFYSWRKGFLVSL